MKSHKQGITLFSTIEQLINDVLGSGGSWKGEEYACVWGVVCAGVPEGQDH